MCSVFFALCTVGNIWMKMTTYHERACLEHWYVCFRFSVAAHVFPKVYLVNLRLVCFSYLNELLPCLNRAWISMCKQKPAPPLISKTLSTVQVDAEDHMTCSLRLTSGEHEGKIVFPGEAHLSSTAESEEFCFLEHIDIIRKAVTKAVCFCLQTGVGNAAICRLIFFFSARLLLCWNWNRDGTNLFPCVDPIGRNN